MKPTTLTMAKSTTMARESAAPRPSPKRLVIHSAPVRALERRIQAER